MDFLFELVIFNLSSYQSECLPFTLAMHFSPPPYTHTYIYSKYRHILLQDLSSFCGERDTQKRDSQQNKNGAAAFLSYWSEGDLGGGGGGWVEESKKTPDMPLEDPDTSNWGQQIICSDLRLVSACKRKRDKSPVKLLSIDKTWVKELPEVTPVWVFQLQTAAEL